jgi:hypothetical protein
MESAPSEGLTARFSKYLTEAAVHCLQHLGHSGAESLRSFTHSVVFDFPLMTGAELMR